MLHVAIYQPKIPPNTGNIARQCVGMGACLHLIGPHALDLSDRAVRRAGLDYWPYLQLLEHQTPEAFLDWLGDRKPWLVTKYGLLRYDQPAYCKNTVLVFGNEIDGLPITWRRRWAQQTVYIPIMGEVRSYNLANAAAIVTAHACLVSGMYERNCDRH